jgi:serine/threonine protein phosphatase PrpC
LCTSTDLYSNRQENVPAGDHVKTLAVCSTSDTGIRPANEDAYLVSRLTSPCGDFTLLSVADGLGGHPAGEVASQLAVRALEKIMQERLQSLQNFDSPSLCSLLSFAFRETNETISRLAEANPEWSGMATTLVAALISGDDTCVIGNVGDSRAYRISEKLERITRDHSRVQELVDGGFLSPEEAEHHPHKNIVTRIVGREGDAPDIFTCRLGSSILLLCSDGLPDGLTEREIFSVISGTEFPVLCSELVREAKQRSRDNITVIAAKWPDETGLCYPE